MNYKVTTITENTVPMGKGLTGEHGICFLIETGTKKILFDTGQGLVLTNNAKVLNIDLKEIDTVILSHGHYDHAGGLQSLVELNHEFTLVAHPDAFDKKMMFFNEQYIPVGMQLDKAYLESKGVTIQLEKGPVEITEGVTTTGEIPLKTDFEKVETVFYTETDNNKIPDTIADDQSLILNTDKGTVVLLGCAHRGLINILNHVSTLTGSKKIHTIMGGLHLVNASESKLKKIIGCMHDFDLQKVGVSHCTGINATIAIANEFKEKFFLNTAGFIATF